MCYNSFTMKTKLTPDQENAVKLIEEWFFNTDDKVFVLSGYAGTGKTFLIDYLVRKVLRLKAGTEAVFVAPTGKAAANLAKKGTPAGTVHSLIYTQKAVDVERDEKGRVLQERLEFVKRSSIDSTIRLIVVDEASMINGETYRDLLSFQRKILFAGDGAQLPPVDGSCVLMQNPHYTLTQIVRQAVDNPIFSVATMAREGKRIPYGNYGDKVCVISKNVLSEKERKRLFLKADQIICGSNKTRAALNREVRGYLGYAEEGELPCAGEKLICTLNDWCTPLDEDERFFLVNGTIGRAENITTSVVSYADGLARMDFTADFMEYPVNVPFDMGIFLEDRYFHRYGDKALTLTNGVIVHEGNKKQLRKYSVLQEEGITRFEYAYAITCHKAQGSEFGFVVVFDESYIFGEEKDRWLYTAITRAKEKLLIIR